jgi:hypothetical protein
VSDGPEEGGFSPWPVLCCGVQGDDTLPAVSERWTDLVDDMEATAAEYEAGGYETLALHTADVTPLSAETTLDVLVPGEEFEQVHTRFANATVDEFTVYTATEGGVTFAVVVAEDHDGPTAACIPLFYQHARAQPLRDRVETLGHVTVRVRPLTDDARVEFTIEDPALLF